MGIAWLGNMYRVYHLRRSADSVKFQPAQLFGSPSRFSLDLNTASFARNEKEGKKKPRLPNSPKKTLFC